MWTPDICIHHFPCDDGFAAAWYVNYGGKSWSLRSEDSRTDVSAVAKGFGGGGHRNAAGFRTPL